MSTLYITQNQFIVCVVILLPTHHLFNYINLIPASFFSGEEGRAGEGGGGELADIWGKIV